jgi:hypothetical protein
MPLHLVVREAVIRGLERKIREIRPKRVKVNKYPRK